MEEFEGYVDRITFRNEENGYTVLYLVKPQTDSEEEEEECCVVFLIPKSNPVYVSFKFLHDALHSCKKFPITK